jgi:hypothetical protein
MKCPYQDIVCWHIDDATQECDQASKTYCPHEIGNESEQLKRKKDDER